VTSKINIILATLLIIAILVVIFLAGFYYGRKQSAPSSTIANYLKTSSSKINSLSGIITQINTSGTNQYIIINKVNVKNEGLINPQPNQELQKINLKVNLKNTEISIIPTIQLPPFPLPDGEIKNSQLPSYTTQKGNLNDLKIGKEIFVESKENLTELSQNEITAVSVQIYINNSVTGKITQLTNSEITVQSNNANYRFSLSSNTYFFDLLKYSRLDLEKLKTADQVKVITNTQIENNQISPALYIDIINPVVFPVPVKK